MSERTDIAFVDPIESTDTYEWRCTRCGDYIISRKRPKCENCDEPEREAMEAPCDCEHGRDFHTFAPDGESLCDLCPCADYRRAARDIVALQPHERIVP